MNDLPPIEAHSQTWRHVKAWAEERLKGHQATVEAPGMPMAETEGARGAIRELRLLLALASPKTRSVGSASEHVE